VRGEVSAWALGAGKSGKTIEWEDVESYKNLAQTSTRRRPRRRWSSHGDGGLHTPTTVIIRIYVALSTAACEMSCSRLWWQQTSTPISSMMNGKHTRGGCAPVGECSPREAMHKRASLFSRHSFFSSPRRASSARLRGGSRGGDGRGHVRPIILTSAGGVPRRSSRGRPGGLLLGRLKDDDAVVV